MKIAVTGKGGVGKTTFAATLARLMLKRQKVLAADVNPDANLGLALGFSEGSPGFLLYQSQMKTGRREPGVQQRQ